MARKQGARDPTWSTRPSGGGKPDRYTCVYCDEPRSPSYHARHPSNEPPPPPGLCRVCVEKIRANKSPPPAVTINEIHHHHTHHYHYCKCTKEQNCSSYSWNDDNDGRSLGETLSHCDMSRTAELPSSPSCVELPAENQQRRLPAPHQLFERTPPPVAPWTKPGYQNL